MKVLHQFILAAASTVAVFSQSQDPAVKAKSQPTQPKQAAKSPAPKTAGQTTGGGMVVVIDPATGQVREATAAEIGAIGAPSPSPSSAQTSANQFAPVAPVGQPGPGGSVVLTLDGSNDTFSVMTKGPDGKLSMECVTENPRPPSVSPQFRRRSRGCSMRSRLPIIAVASALVFALPAFPAATIVIQNGDPAGVGFNDATVVAPVGGNTGTTLGQQRLIAFQYAANIWGATITSSVPIVVLATWEPLSCTATGACWAPLAPSACFATSPALPRLRLGFRSRSATSTSGWTPYPPAPTSAPDSM